MHTVLFKKTGYCLYLIFLLSSIFIFNPFTYSQTSYVMNIYDGRYLDNHTFEFDIYIKSIGGQFELTSYQCVLSFNNKLADDGKLEFMYVDGSSELSNSPVNSIGINSTDDLKELTFASMPGSDNISDNFIRVGTFHLVTSGSFEITQPQISWDFDGMIETILTGNRFQNITEVSNHTGGFTSSPGTGIEVKDFLLDQNYPNPFNPSTKIRFSLKENGKVRLVIYNLLGEQVNELLNNEMTKGVHEIEFNAAGLASGIYIYRIDVENKFSSVRKMILAK